MEDKLTKKLKSAADEWVELEEVAKQIRSELKAVNDRKKEVTQEITQIMGHLKTTRLPMRTGSLRYVTTTSFVPVNKDHVFAVLSRELRNEDLAEDLTEKIFKTMRPRVEKNVIKHDPKKK